MHLQLIDTDAAFRELKPEWSAFACCIPNLSPFQFPEWMITWWRHFGSGEMHTLVFRHAGRVAGIVPAFLHEWNGRRQMTLIGSGLSDYLDPVIAPRFRGEIADALGAHLESDTRWEICDWQDLSIDTPLRRIPMSRDFDIRLKSDTECTTAPLPPSFDEFWRQRSKDLRRNVVRYRKKAEGQGAVTFEATCEARPEIVDGLIALHTMRWQARGEPGMIEANHSACFLRQIAQEFADLGLLRLFALRISDKIAAAIAAWLHEQTLFFYLSGFDPQFERFSPGQILLFECVRYSYEQGCRQWNFLRGTEAYKFAWGAKPVPKCRVLITRS